MDDLNRLDESTRFWVRFRSTAEHSRSAGIIFAVLAIMLVLLGIINPRLWSVTSVSNLFNAALPLVFAAIAQTIIILVKGIDLSVGPTMSFVMVIAASLMRDSFIGIVGSVLFCLLAGAAIGALNGALVVGPRLQPIIATLATSSVVSGAALYVLSQPGGYIPPAFAFVASGALGIIPVPVLVLLAVFFLLWIPLRQSGIGRAWYAVGGSEGGAYYSGIDVNRTKFVAYVFAGVFAALGGLFLAAETQTGDPTIGAPYTLSSIAATVLGGTNLAGGRGGAGGAICGAFVLTVIVDILFFLGVSAYYQLVFTGVIVILALAVGTMSDTVKSNRDAVR